MALSPITFTVRDPDPSRSEDAFGVKHHCLRALFCCHECHAAVQGWVTPELIEDAPVGVLFDLRLRALNAFLDAHGKPPCSHAGGAPRQSKRLVLAKGAVLGRGDPPTQAPPPAKRSLSE